MTTLGTQRTTDTTLTIPAWGQWRADMTLEGGTLPSGPQTLTMGTLQAVGTVARAGYDAPDLPHVVLIGGIGWDSEVTVQAAARLSMFADPGVRLSSVLRALAACAGEAIEQPTDATIGLHWNAISTRPGERTRYRDVLTAMVRAGMIVGWYVGLDGTTRFAARPTSAVGGRAILMRARGDVGLRVFGIDDPAEFMPGATVEGVAIGRAVIVETPDSLTAEAWSPNGAPTIRENVIRMVGDAFPALLYGYPRTYIVDSVNADDTLNLVPPPDKQYLRELKSVAQWNLAGAVVTPAAGAVATVVFRDADWRTPAVTSWAPGIPDEVKIDAGDLVEVGPSASDVELAGGGAAVGRVGDGCGRLIFDPALLTLYYSPSAVAPYVAVAPNATTPVAPLPGAAGTSIAIASGSSKVTSG